MPLWGPQFQFMPGCQLGAPLGGARRAGRGVQESSGGNPPPPIALPRAMRKRARPPIARPALRTGVRGPAPVPLKNGRIKAAGFAALPVFRAGSPLWGFLEMGGAKEGGVQRGEPVGGGRRLGALDHAARERVRLLLASRLAGVLLYGVAGRTGRTAFHGLSGSGPGSVSSPWPRFFFKVTVASRGRGRRPLFHTPFPRTAVYAAVRCLQAKQASFG